jgi:hypothetical protein
MLLDVCRNNFLIVNQIIQIIRINIDGNTIFFDYVFFLSLCCLEFQHVLECILKIIQNINYNFPLNRAFVEDILSV